MTLGYPILLIVIIVLMIIGFRRARNERMREFDENMKKLTMPCGELVPSDDELLSFTEEDLDAYLKNDLLWLINYVGHKVADEGEKWHPLFDMCTHVKNLKHWW